MAPTKDNAAVTTNRSIKTMALPTAKRRHRPATTFAMTFSIIFVTLFVALGTLSSFGSSHTGGTIDGDNDTLFGVTARSKNILPSSSSSRSASTKRRRRNGASRLLRALLSPPPPPPPLLLLSEQTPAANATPSSSTSTTSPPSSFQDFSCDALYKNTIPNDHQQQCLYARTCNDGDGMFAPLLFCSSRFSLRTLSLMLAPPLILLLVVLFRLISSTAEDFFSPSLEMYSREMGLPHRFAGITLLALGNGAPDVSATVNGIMND
eukprot:CAMPEP_0172507950 /NCGR_PEP_ID=MMETSP1066-20121228/208037_1 /TAXON_ID=671091 /ORGANISM="Coscinodiscus wailesii, Strain CCMP2513" /LENGTH=263 /DNA_ID=CAMNT_0013285715 /DNA_START=48 /DNA_END=836 /DNA_ORIENTATION=-